MGRDTRQQQESLRVFKGVTVFDWEAEPTDERPSSFVESTQYGALLQHVPRRTAPAPLEVRRPRPPQKRAARGGNVWIALLIAVALSAAALFAYSHFVRASESSTARP